MIDCAFKILKYEGIKGYYKGLLPNFMKALPAVSISYGTFEYIKKQLIEIYN
jgi:solute carrier family 25 phosphate transporter 23/24/25/41